MHVRGHGEGNAHGERWGLVGGVLAEGVLVERTLEREEARRVVRPVQLRQAVREPVVRCLLPRHRRRVEAKVVREYASAILGQWLCKGERCPDGLLAARGRLDGALVLEVAHLVVGAQCGWLGEHTQIELRLSERKQCEELRNLATEDAPRVEHPRLDRLVEDVIDQVVHRRRVGCHREVRAIKGRKVDREALHVGELLRDVRVAQEERERRDGRRREGGGGHSRHARWEDGRPRLLRKEGQEAGRPDRTQGRSHVRGRILGIWECVDGGRVGTDEHKHAEQGGEHDLA